MAKTRGILVKASEYDRASSVLRSAGIYTSALATKFKFHLGSAFLGALAVGAVALIMYLT